MSHVTFRPTEYPEQDVMWAGTPYIVRLVIDESGAGVEIRIMSDGQVLSLPLTQGVAHYRSSPLWEEEADEAVA